VTVTARQSGYEGWEAQEHSVWEIANSMSRDRKTLASRLRRSIVDCGPSSVPHLDNDERPGSTVACNAVGYALVVAGVPAAAAAVVFAAAAAAAVVVVAATVVAVAAAGVVDFAGFAVGFAAAKFAAVAEGEAAAAVIAVAAAAGPAVGIFEIDAKAAYYDAATQDHFVLE
jgi:hypothetical protein